MELEDISPKHPKSMDEIISEINSIDFFDEHKVDKFTLSLMQALALIEGAEHECDFLYGDNSPVRNLLYACKKMLIYHFQVYEDICDREDLFSEWEFDYYLCYWNRAIEKSADKQ